MSQYWKVYLKSRLGYSCETRIGWDNAVDVGQAKSIAGMMFPELQVVSAELHTSEGDAAATYRDCPELYRAQKNGAVPRCLRSLGHPNSHVSLFENHAIFWDTKPDGTIVYRGNGNPYSRDEPNELSG